MQILTVTDHVVLLAFLLAIEAVCAVPFRRNDNEEHKLSKRNFVPNRFDIIDNEIKHAIQKEVENALRKNFVPDNPLLEAKKWGKSSPSRYPINQPSMIYGMEYDENNPSRSDPGYLVLDLKQLSQGHLKFHEQKMGGQVKKAKAKARPRQGKQQQNVQSPYYAQQQNYGQYQPYYNGYQPNTQQYNQYGYQNYQQQQQQQQQSNNNGNPGQTNPQYSQYPQLG